MYLPINFIFGHSFYQAQPSSIKSAREEEVAVVEDSFEGGGGDRFGGGGDRFREGGGGYIEKSREILEVEVEAMVLEVEVLGVARK